MARPLVTLLRWLRDKVAAIQAAQRESARNVLNRVLYAVLAFMLAGDLWDAGSLTLWSLKSQSAAIASLVGREPVGVAFLVLSVAVLPFALAELCLWVRRRRRFHAMLAMAGLGLGGALFLMLFVAARNADLDVIRLVYARSGLVCVVMMLLIGTGLNADLRTAHALDNFEDESNRVPLE